jgi:hypothetical protein
MTCLCVFRLVNTADTRYRTGPDQLVCCLRHPSSRVTAFRRRRRTGLRRTGAFLPHSHSSRFKHHDSCRLHGLVLDRTLPEAMLLPCQSQYRVQRSVVKSAFHEFRSLCTVYPGWLHTREDLPPATKSSNRPESSPRDWLTNCHALVHVSTDLLLHRLHLVAHLL